MIYNCESDNSFDVIKRYRSKLARIKSTLVSMIHGEAKFFFCTIYPIFSFCKVPIAIVEVSNETYRAVSMDEGKDLADKWHCSFFQISSESNKTKIDKVPTLLLSQLC